MSGIMNDTAVSSAASGGGITLVTASQQQQQSLMAAALSAQHDHQMQVSMQQQQHQLQNNVTSSNNNNTNHHMSMQQQQSVPPVVVLSKQRLHELVQEIDPSEQLDEEVEDALLHMADDFIDQTVTAACQMARHRDSRTLEVRDVQLVLEKEWNISIPGFGTPLSQLNRFKSHSATTEAHKQRMALIKKTLKKM